MSRINIIGLIGFSLAALIDLNARSSQYSSQNNAIKVFAERERGGGLVGG